LKALFIFISLLLSMQWLAAQPGKKPLVGPPAAKPPQVDLPPPVQQPAPARKPVDTGKPAPVTIPMQGPVATMQVATPTIQNVDSAKRSIKILDNERMYINQKDSFRYIVGHVVLKQENTLFKADSVYYSEKGRYLEAFGRVYINESDSVITTARYLKYYIDTRIAELKNDVFIKTKTGNFSGSAVMYDMSSKMASYNTASRIAARKSVLTSRAGQYYTTTKDAIFTDKVVLKDPDYDIYTDTLFFNTTTEVANFVTYTKVINKKRKQTIETTRGFYDMRKGVASFTERTIIRDSSRIVAGEQLNFDDKAKTVNITNGYILDTAKGQYVSGLRIAIDDKNKYMQIEGNGIYKDSIEGFAITGNYIFSDDKTGRSMATGKPVAIIKQDNDSIYIAADTLYSGRVVNNKKIVTDSIIKMTTVDSLKGTGVPLSDSAMAIGKNDTVKTVVTQRPRNRRNSRPVVTDSLANDNTPADSAKRYFEGFHHVRIFSDSVQAVCDSVYYSTVDSVFRLYQQPVVWNNENQITGDTMYLFTKNKKTDRVEVFENAFVVNRVQKQFYNQIKGNRIDGYFVNGEMDSLRARGSAEIIFYIQDEDSAFVGVDKSLADLIYAYFQNREIYKIKWVNKYEARTTPMKEANHNSLRLRGFSWQEARRPKSKFELFFR
jgi:lipopolysaccharide export system protein LptA